MDDFVEGISLISASNLMNNIFNGNEEYMQIS